MQAYEISSFSLDSLQPIEEERIPVGPGEVRLRIRAVSLNYRDLLVVRGHYNPRQALPLIPCSDAVALVEEIGEGVAPSWLGKRVCPLFCQGWESGPPTRARLRDTLGSPNPGVLRESMVLPLKGVVPVPEHLTDEEAATLPCAGLTAWSALVEQAELRPGARVLLLGTGGVSIWALQLAHAMGFETVITSSSNEKLERARELGADSTINYKEEPEWGKKVAKMGGADLVVEVGGAGTLEQSIKACKVGGQVSLIGVLAGAQQLLSVLPILMRQLKIQGILVGHRDAFEGLAGFVQHRKVHPQVGRVFDFSQARKAFEHLASGAHFGKVCIRV